MQPATGDDLTMYIEHNHFVAEQVFSYDYISRLEACMIFHFCEIYNWYSHRLRQKRGRTLVKAVYLCV
jgi:hypothetical protein